MCLFGVRRSLWRRALGCGSTASAHSQDLFFWPFQLSLPGDDSVEGGYTAQPGPASTKTYPELRQRTDPFPIIRKSLTDWNALEDKKEFNRSIPSY